MNLRGLLERLAAEFERAGIETPGVDAELLVGHVFEMSRGELQAAAFLDKEFTPEQFAQVESLAARRAAREPLQHITGLAYFRNLTLKVGKGVFTPRPETESVAQLAIDALRFQANPEPIAVDLGTGSGAIALAIASEVPNAKVFAVEKSPDALPFTRANFAAANLDNATLVEGDFGDTLFELDGKVTLVISNPPYIPNEAIPRDIEVRLHDPAMALYGGEDGMDAMHVISKRGLELLHQGGILVVEHADSQSEQVRQLLLADGWRQVSAHSDLTGRHRSVTAVR